MDFNFNFDFSDTAENIDEILDTSKGKSKGPFKGIPFYGVGLHKDVPIMTSKWSDYPCKGDPTWKQLWITMGSEGKKVSFNLLVPTQKLTFGASANPLWAFQKLGSFLKAIGVSAPITKENLAEVLASVFGDLNQLVGKRLDISVGYDGYYAHYVEKNSFHCYNAKNEPEMDGDNPIQFEAREAVELWCKDRGKYFSPYNTVKFFNAPTTANDLLTVGAPKAKKTEATQKKNVDLGW